MNANKFDSATFTVRIEDEHGDVQVFRVEAEMSDTVDILSVHTDGDISDYFRADDERSWLWDYLKRDIDLQYSAARRNAQSCHGVSPCDISLRRLMEVYADA